MLVIRGAYIRGGLYSGGAYIRDFMVCYNNLIFGPLHIWSCSQLILDFLIVIGSGEASILGIRFLEAHPIYVSFGQFTSRQHCIEFISESHALLSFPSQGPSLTVMDASHRRLVSHTKI